MKKTTDILTCILRAALLRQRLRRGIFAAGVFLTLGTCAAFVLLLIGSSSRSVFLPPVFFFSGFFSGVLFPVSVWKTARSIDERLALRGRLATAVEIASENSYPPSVIEVQRQDACRKVAELLSAEPDLLTRILPLNVRSLFMPFIFYLSFAVVLWTIPAEKLRVMGRPSTSSLSVGTEAPENAEEILNRARNAVKEISEENPQSIPVRELLENIERISSLHGAEVSPSVSVLMEWEGAFSDAIEEIVAADAARTNGEVSLPNSDIRGDGSAAAASVLREELGRIIGCRLKMSEKLSRSGGEGASDPGKSRKTWGSGRSGESPLSESDPADPYERTVDLVLPGKAALSKLTADPSDPNDLSSIEGRSTRESEPISFPADTAADIPVEREVVPPEMEELVKRYFDR